MYRENCEKSIPTMYDFQYEYDDNKKDDVNTYKYMRCIYGTTMAPSFHNIRTMIWEIKRGKSFVK